MTDNFKTDAPTLTFEPFGAGRKRRLRPLRQIS